MIVFGVFCILHIIYRTLVNSLALGNLDAILKMEFSILFYWLVSSGLLMMIPSDECHRTLLIISQHWFRLWLGAVRQQAITRANVDPDLCRQMASLDLNELRRECCLEINSHGDLFGSGFQVLRTGDYTPRFNEGERGVTGFTLSVCPSVDRIVSALYLQQYSSDPFHICTCFKIQKFEILANSLNL